MIHAFQILPKYFNPVRYGEKKFNICLNNRDYCVGDYLALNEWDGSKYTGRTQLVKVCYIINLAELVPCEDGYVIMSIQSIDKFDSSRSDNNDHHE